MKYSRNYKALIAAGSLAILLTGCLNPGGSDSMKRMDHSMMNHSKPSQPDNGKTASNSKTEKTRILTGNEFALIAVESNQQLSTDVTLPVWTFNNSVPGPEIRVKQGETVKVRLTNRLPEPVTIHWHGIPVPNAMDGIPGVTQNAVQPGQSFTYEFKAEVPGTYWYHSHQDSVNQVDRGLYGAFIVEPKDADKVDRDYTLVLDEWMSSGIPETSNSTGMSEMSGMSGMGHDNMNRGDSENHAESNAAGNDNQPTGMGHNMSMYDLFTVNGKSGPLVDKLPVKQGDKVRIRLINAGYLSHQIHLHGHEFYIAAVDGQPINHPGVVKDNLVRIAPGERYDIEFKANHPGQWLIEDHGANKAVAGMKAVIAYEGADLGPDRPNETANLAAVDMDRYGQAGPSSFTLDQKYTLEYTMNLNTEMKMGGMVYTINGKTFPETEPLNVKKGDTVKVRLINRSMMDDHPMHLHGHFFQVLSKNGQPLQGAPLIKDTLNVRPGEEYIVAFRADNEGNWMFHCHDLHHASAGMVTEVKYTDYKTNFKADPKAGNMPE
ncbi:multicopper oxidase family protein [Ferviditalea candida]